MIRFWRWIKASMWWSQRKAITKLRTENDYLQQRVLELEEQRRVMEEGLDVKLAQINEKSSELKDIIKSTKTNISESKKLAQRQENEIYAIGEKLKVAEETIEGLVAGHKVLSERWKTQVMLEGYKQGQVSGSKTGEEL